MDVTTFINQFETLPKEIQQQIIHYAETYFKKLNPPKSKSKYKFDWESGASHVNESAVELQHKANEWR